MVITRATLLRAAEETHDMKIPPSRLEAHRGASGAYPENTMLAFAKAREAGALSIETDLSLLADGGFAVFHDSALGRTVAGDASLDSLTSAEIGTMDAGAWRGREFAGEARRFRFLRTFSIGRPIPACASTSR